MKFLAVTPPSIYQIPTFMLWRKLYLLLIILFMVTDMPIRTKMEILYAVLYTTQPQK